MKFWTRKKKKHEELELPPKALRFMNEGDEKFVDIGRQNIKLLEEYGLDEISSLLDIGSGYGRLAYALHKEIPVFSGNYVGMDILPKHVKWCQENIESKLSNYKFHHLNVINNRYNPKGNIEADEVELEYKPLKFDIVCLFSVFTHMFENDIKHYLSEIHQNLKDGGICVATFFIYDDERLSKINDRVGGAITMHHKLNEHTRYYNSEDKLHAISFKKDKLVKACSELGFKVNKTVYGDWAGGIKTGFYQDYLVLEKL